MCLLAIIYLLWTAVYSDPLPIFKLGYLSFLLLNCKSFLCILNISPLSDIRFTKFFSILWAVFSLAWCCPLRQHQEAVNCDDVQLTLEQLGGEGADPCAVKNPHVTLQSALVIHGSTSRGLPSLGVNQAQIVVLQCILTEKNLHVSGPEQFKSMLY